MKRKVVDFTEGVFFLFPTDDIENEENLFDISNRSGWRGEERKETTWQETARKPGDQVGKSWGGKKKTGGEKGIPWGKAKEGDAKPPAPLLLPPFRPRYTYVRRKQSIQPLMSC